MTGNGLSFAHFAPASRVAHLAPAPSARRGSENSIVTVHQFLQNRQEFLDVFGVQARDRPCQHADPNPMTLSYSSSQKCLRSNDSCRWCFTARKTI